MTNAFLPLHAMMMMTNEFLLLCAEFLSSMPMFVLACVLATSLPLSYYMHLALGQKVRHFKCFLVVFGTEASLCILFAMLNAVLDEQEARTAKSAA